MRHGKGVCEWRDGSRYEGGSCNVDDVSIDDASICIVLMMINDPFAFLTLSRRLAV